MSQYYNISYHHPKSFYMGLKKSRKLYFKHRSYQVFKKSKITYVLRHVRHTYVIQIHKDRMIYLTHEKVDI